MDEDHLGLFDSQDGRYLARMARVLFPHRGLTAGPYERAAVSLMSRSSRSVSLLYTLQQGLVELRGALPLAASDDLLHRALQERAGTPFFAAVRDWVAFDLYDDREVWAYIGYPGASFHLGGYLHRGFDDLDWLPEPRVTEADGPLLEIGPDPRSSERTHG